MIIHAFFSSIFLFVIIYYNGDIMELEIEKTAFLDVDKIVTLKSHMENLVAKHYENDIYVCKMEINLTYLDTSNNECFKSLQIDISLDDNLKNITDTYLNSVKMYVIDGRGVNVDYALKIICDDSKEVEIVNLDDDNKEELSSDEEQITLTDKDADIEQIKKDLSKDYEDKLADNLNKRDAKIAITTTKTNESELDFIKFFDENVAAYYSIRTLLAPNEESLNAISKQYNVPLETLLKGYDKEHGKVTFRL